MHPSNAFGQQIAYTREPTSYEKASYAIPYVVVQFMLSKRDVIASDPRSPRRADHRAPTPVNDGHRDLTREPNDVNRDRRRRCRDTRGPGLAEARAFFVSGLRGTRDEPLRTDRVP